MNFSIFSKRLHPNLLSGINNQGEFVGALFTIAGSKQFPPRPMYGTDSYQKKLCSGAKPLTQAIKNSFPRPIRSEALSTFFNERIGTTSLPLIMNKFGIPDKEAKNKELFSMALAAQFQSIITDAADDVDDIVLVNYISLLRQFESSGFTTTQISDAPLYTGDDAILICEEPPITHTVGFYEEFEHTWVLKNSGDIVWHDRRLIFTNQDKTRIKSRENFIKVPLVNPGNEVMLCAKLIARGFEGVFETEWAMVDDSDHLCFTGKNMVLKAIVSVENKSTIKSEV